VVVLISRKTGVDFSAYLKERSYDYLICGERRVNLKKAYNALTEKYKINTIMVDSGPTLNGVLLNAGLIDEISLLVFPVLVGKRSNKLLAQIKIGNQNVNLKLLDEEKLENGLVSLRYQLGFPISTLIEPTSNIFVLETDDIPLPSDCQPD